MSRDLPCLDSTPVNSSELRNLSPQPSAPRLNCALTYVEEVSELLQQSLPFSVNPDNNPVETIPIRAIEPEYKQVIAIEPLTARELAVLQLIVEGHNNSTIAEKLHITMSTVKTHVRNILKKLYVNGRTQAAVRALRSGLAH